MAGCLELSIREGFLLKQTSSFQRWKRRFFKLRGRTLYYAKDAKSLIFDEVELTEAIVAENSTKNVNNSFTVITAFRRLVLCAESRKDMEDWISALKSVQNRDPSETCQLVFDHFSGSHNWFACGHARPTFCNVCREALSGVTNHGLSCEVCKFKVHKRCAARASNNCKWTTLASVGGDVVEDEDGVWMPHQWLEGNLPVSARCSVCDKACGSVLRMQDWRCLWCKAMVHSACRDQVSRCCPFGQCKVSVIPPTALNSIDSDGFWKASCPPSCTSPLLVFVNSKSGDNQGVKFLRRFKQLLNPAQVFDLMNGGPHLGLRLFQKFHTFRILVCGGDGSVGWVLSEIDQLSLHKQCQMGVLPLGTGNDLARVLGWGSACDDDTQLPQILEKLERASTKMLDRWSIMSCESHNARDPIATDAVSLVPEEDADESKIQAHIASYELSVAEHLTKILNSDQHAVVISSAKVLCETVKDFVAQVGREYEQTTDNQQEAEIMAVKCSVLNEKLASLLCTLNDESKASSGPAPIATTTIVEEPAEAEIPASGSGSSPEAECSAAPGTRFSRRTSKPQIFRPREQLMSRANSLKKAIRQIIEHAEQAVDEQNAQTESQLSISSSSITTSMAALSHFTASVPEQPEAEGDREQDVGMGESEGQEVEKGTLEEQGKIADLACKKDSKQMAKSGKQSEVSSGLSGSKENLPMLSSRFLAHNLRSNLPSSCYMLGSCISTAMGTDNDLLEDFSEKGVMNNYFGIGLDAKILLDFNNRRDEHPEKCRSRTKNLMWYGVLGTKELLQKTYKNLEQRVLLECDGQQITLPRLQGVAVLNIQSYAGGTNFWGGTKENDVFTAPSFDDKILEVVAVYGSMQMAMSRVMKLQYHRIAQCRSVKITILGEGGVPVQVDGEAWVQPPGLIRIVHKNRAQMLTRDRAFESTLKLWEDKMRCDSMTRPPSLNAHPDSSAGDETLEIQQLACNSRSLIAQIHTAAQEHNGLEQELAHAVNAASHSLQAFYGHAENPTQAQVLDLVTNVRALHSETEQLLCGKLQLESKQEEQLGSALSQLDQSFCRLASLPWLTHALAPSDVEGSVTDLSKRERGGSRFRLFRRDKTLKPRECRANVSLPVHQWGTEEVGAWLELLSLSVYREAFEGNDIQGKELLNLERRDLKELGVTKVGHVKRILAGIKELQRRSSSVYL
uniref:diacylglycerol kinase delta isoform X2 n=3 Tax=Myxine glutinosa TaxID=7769 RepID=UPI00358F5A21